MLIYLILILFLVAYIGYTPLSLFLALLIFLQLDLCVGPQQGFDTIGR